MDRVYTANEIKRLRKELKMTQKALAAELGVSRRTVEDWEAGRRNPRGSVRVLLGRLDVSGTGGMLPREINVFLAKSRMIESIHALSQLEGINVTFPQTERIVLGDFVDGIPVRDIQTVLNLKAAWIYILNTLDEPLTVDYVWRVNEVITCSEGQQWGYHGGGEEFRVAGAIVADILQIKDPVQQAVSFFCRAMKARFLGNSSMRTSLIVANRILIAHGAGILRIRETIAGDLTAALKAYYITDNPEIVEMVLKRGITPRL